MDTLTTELQTARRQLVAGATILGVLAFLAPIGVTIAVALVR